MKRRDVITLLGGAAATPILATLAARAQQAMPLVGILSAGPAEASVDRMRALRLGLKDAGYVEGVAFEYRWAENQIDRLPVLAAELVRRQVSVIVATGTAPALAAKAATAAIPIVFAVSDDPVKLGLVASIARPGGNATGINFFSGELVAKRLELLRELVPGAKRVAVLVNPTARAAETTVRDAELAARTMGLQIQVLNAISSQEINAALASLARARPDALFVDTGALFGARRVQLSLLAARHGLPATYPQREFVEAGGLMSYGTNLSDAYRQQGAYAGRVLKGAKPADLPVVQPTKFELVINAESARMLGLTVPPTLLAIADEVIE